LSEIVGSRSSGATSLLAALLARATAAGSLVALVDGADSFDPARAAAGGADLSALLWVRCCGRAGSAFPPADLPARWPGCAVGPMDLVELGARARVSLPPARWLRLQRAVEGSQTVLVARTSEPSAGSAASLVVAASRDRAGWIGTPHPTRLGGLVSDIRVVRSRRAALAERPPVRSIAW